MEHGGVGAANGAYDSSHCESNPAMSEDQPVVGSYGWRGHEKQCSQDYLAPELISTLRGLGARRILDLGCGNGAFPRSLIEAGMEVLGCDADAEGIEHARKGGGEFRVASVYDDPIVLKADGFDAVVSAEVVEHLFSPHRLPQYAAAVLKSDGYLLVTTPYHGYLKNLVLALLNKWDIHANPLWEGGHIKFFSRRTLSELIEDNGFQVIGFKGLGRLPYLWKSMLIVAKRR